LGGGPGDPDAYDSETVTETILCTVVGVPLLDPAALILSTTSIPEVTVPKSV
jgi:hypothetical protein